MNYTNSEAASRGSNPYWFKSIRTFIARALLRSGITIATWTERAALRVAPWLTPERAEHAE